MNSRKQALRLCFPWIGIFLGYAILVAAFHHDMLKHLGTKILAGWQVGGVLVWECWWFQKSILFSKELTPFFTTMLMYPSGLPIFIHSPLYTSFCLLLAPLKNCYLTYNIFCLVGYVLRGFSMASLAYYVTRHYRAAFFSGLVFMFSLDNLTQNYLGHAGQANAVFIPLFIQGTLMMADNASTKNFFIFLLAAIGCALTSVYMDLQMFVIFLPCFILLSLKIPVIRTSRISFYTKVLVGLVIVGMIDLLAYWPVLKFRNELILGGQEIYALKLKSLILPPFWRESFLSMKWGLMDTPEERMGFFSWDLLIFIPIFLRKKDYLNNILWVVLFIVGIIFSMGPFLSLFGTKVIMPYWIFEHLPFMKSFRAPARLIQLSWIGISILSGVAIKNIYSSSFSKILKSMTVFAIGIIFIFEMGVSSVAARTTELENGASYHLIKEDPARFGILELPAAIDKEGTVSINTQLFMLQQPLHEKPLVLGRPGRHSVQSIALCQNTDVLFELTHPNSLPELYRRKELQGRLELLKKSARSILSSHSIKYVVLHSKEEFFSDLLMKSYARFLKDCFGSPVSQDEFGLVVFQVYSVEHH